VQLALLPSRQLSGTALQQSKYSPVNVGQQLPVRPQSSTHLLFKLHVSSTDASPQQARKTPSTEGQQSPVRLPQDGNKAHVAVSPIDGTSDGMSEGMPSRKDDIIVGGRDWGAWGGMATVGKGANTVGGATVSSSAASGAAMGVLVGTNKLLLGMLAEGVALNSSGSGVGVSPVPLVTMGMADVGVALNSSGRGTGMSAVPFTMGMAGGLVALNSRGGAGMMSPVPFTMGIGSAVLLMGPSLSPVVKLIMMIGPAGGIEM
jgi:hypothetical protein